MLDSRAPADPPVVLSLDVGSSSLKAAVRDPDLRMHAEISGLRDGPEAEPAHVTISGTGSFVEHARLSDGWTGAVAEIADAMARRGLYPDVIAHRVVHGTPLLAEPRRADELLVARLRGEAHLDPLHLPRQLAVLEEARARWPGAEMVLVPDGGFFAVLPQEAVTLPLPAEARATGLRRWGFHGLAVQSVIDLLPGLGGAVVVHLGSGCSVTAVQDGRPRSTTMALSPAGGIPSLTRSGDLDPEVVLRLVEQADGSVPAVRELLNRRSGVAGLAGGRTDVRELLAADDAAADLALRVFVRSVAMATAAAVTTLDTWDSLVFSGGIGQHSGEVRELVCARLLTLRHGVPGGSVPSERLVGAGVRVLAVPIDEEAVIDRLARGVLPAVPRPRGFALPKR
ncbi:acetate/propionate family kinase [Geodermatophilus aquaeductus]|uniref:Acetate kinase n=1 Tax=Geodermatophilus aquaeductus TaxID=1564161 RepID=A0A521FV16_9ACTN|nr:acetate/propionate family kinase [Geodermatophilus aquaeductus]SMP00028.1 acetate kinase [Geodermatophilus aquaeductus]